MKPCDASKVVSDPQPFNYAVRRSNSMASPGSILASAGMCMSKTELSHHNPIPHRQQMDHRTLEMMKSSKLPDTLKQSSNDRRGDDDDDATADGHGNSRCIALSSPTGILQGSSNKNSDPKNLVGWKLKIPSSGNLDHGNLGIREERRKRSRSDDEDAFDQDDMHAEDTWMKQLLLLMDGDESLAAF